MTFILVLFLMFNGEIQDTKVVPGFDNQAECQLRAKKAEEFYRNRGLEVVGYCYRPT